MDAQQIARAGPLLERYLGLFDHCMVRREQNEHLRLYVRGQLSDLPRKSVEPIALAAGVPPRNLQQFLSQYRWNDSMMRDTLQRLVACEHADEHATAIFDETYHVKKGKKTPGVQRQWCGTKGATDNCVVTVHLGYATEDFHCLLDSDLFLPKSWADDRERCAEAGIPELLQHRKKTDIALGLLEQAVANGVKFRWVTFDAGYGKEPSFLHELDDRGHQYVGEVPPSFTGWIKKPPVMLKEHSTHRRLTPRGEVIGRPRIFPRVKVLPGGMHKAKSIKNLVRYSPAFVNQPWRAYRVKDTTTGPEVWEAKEAAFYLKRDGVPTWEHRLIVTRHPLTGEIKYFVSNAPPGVRLEEILRVAFTRWRIERCFEDHKGEVGMSHFEGRSYLGLMRHLTLTAVSFLFLARVRARWKAQRGEGSAPDDLPGSSGDLGGHSFALADRSGAATDAGEDRREDQLRPEQHRQRRTRSSTQDPQTLARKRHPALPLAGLPDASEVAL